MKKKLSVLLLSLLCLLILAGCGCEHEWVEADCVNPKHCSLCNETEGNPLGHVWYAATCEKPKTCEVCAATDGDPKGHSWVEATCEEAKHCDVCAAVEGEALGHQWQDATTEQPKTCSSCALTEGERIITDPRFTTAQAKDLIGKWALTMEITGEMMGIPDFPSSLEGNILLEFRNNGELNIGFALVNEEAFMDSMVIYTMNQFYAEFAAQGYTKEQADAAVEATYGISTEAYIRQELDALDFNSLFDSIFEAANIGGVYYVEDGTLYVGKTWQGTMDPDEFTLDGDTLYIPSLSQELGVDAILTRVTED